MARGPVPLFERGLVAILFSMGIIEKSARKIAEKTLKESHSLYRMVNQPGEEVQNSEFYQIKKYLHRSSIWNRTSIHLKYAQAMIWRKRHYRDLEKKKRWLHD